ncbi:MAG: YbaK/EbsC family protein [Euryarchaeota archaeon]|nr:YbaK/EbsC family protein [Euryarchaeota archaeon]
MKKLRRKVRNYDTKFIIFEEKVKTVEQAKKVLNISSKEIIKSLVVAGDEPFVCIVPGNKSVSFKKLKKIYENIRMATKEEVFEATGYEVGGVPPIVDTRVLIDKRVMKRGYVYGGGGNTQTLLRIKPADIVAINENVGIVDIAE